MSPVTTPTADAPFVLDAFSELTSREREVLELVAQGWSNRTVADRLFLSVRTVESHVRTTLMKFGIGHDDRVCRRVVLACIWQSRTREPSNDC